MKLKQMMFAILFGLSMIGQFLVRPAFGDDEIPTGNDWEVDSKAMNLKESTIKKIGKKFETFDQVKRDVLKNPTGLIEFPAENRVGTQSARTYDYKKLISAAEKLTCSLNTIITKLQKLQQKEKNGKYEKAIFYLIEKTGNLSDLVRSYETSERDQQDKLARARDFQSEQKPFDERYVLDSLLDNLRRGMKDYAYANNNPNALGHDRMVDAADNSVLKALLADLERGKPKVYAEIVARYRSRTSKSLYLPLDNVPASEYARMIRELQSAINELYTSIGGK